MALNINLDPIGAMQGFFNYKQQSEAFEYQKKLNAIQMQREDTAFQRGVRDARAAGLSPLAVTGGAPTSALTAGSAPQVSGSGVSASFDPLSYKMQREQQDNNNSVAASQVAKNNADAASAQQDSISKLVSNKYLESDIQSKISERLANIQVKVGEYENLLKDKDLKDSQKLKYEQEIENLKEQARKYKQEVSESKQRVENYKVEYEGIQLQNYEKQLKNTSLFRDLVAAAENYMAPDEYFKVNSSKWAPLFVAGRQFTRVGAHAFDMIKNAAVQAFDRVKTGKNAKQQAAIEARQQEFIRALERAYYDEVSRNNPDDERP